MRGWLQGAGFSFAMVAMSLASGCGQSGTSAPNGKAPPAAVTNASPGKSAAETFIEGASGKTAVDAGRAAQNRIRKISAEHNKDLDEVTE